jgi:hypothetical protein
MSASNLSEAANDWGPGEPTEAEVAAAKDACGLPVDVLDAIDTYGTICVARKDHGEAWYRLCAAILRFARRRGQEGVVMEALPTRGDVGLRECTRDPIFLFQSRRIHLGHLPPDHEPDWDAECIETESRRGDSAYSLVEYAEAFPENVVEEWETRSVWFTREEAERYGEAKAYNFTKGWRVYCVCAEGELAAILKAQSLKPTGTREER